MTKEEDFKLLKIQTCVLKVNIHCDGCKQKVKKLLQRIEGIYQVNIDAELQKVTVSGSVDSATLIKKLVRGGKHAEIWSQKSNQTQNQKQKNNCVKDDKNSNGGQKQQGLMKGLEVFKNQQKFPTFVSEDDDYVDDDEDDDEEDELQFLKAANQLGQIGLLRQQDLDASNPKKGVVPIVAAPNNNKMNNVGNANNAGKKGNNTPNQNTGIRVNPGGIDQETMAALKMNNAHMGGGNINNGDAKRGNDIHAMMGLAGLHGNGADKANATGSAAAFGGNRNGFGGFHVQANNGFQGPSSAAGFPNNGYATGQYPSTMLMNMNGGYTHPSPMMMNMNMNMNMQNRHVMQQQPQMMYHRSPFTPPSTGYYYNHSPAAPYSYPEQPNYNGDHSAATHMFSDENTGSCSIM